MSDIDINISFAKNIGETAVKFGMSRLKQRINP
jgi:hypothetical protein